MSRIVTHCHRPTRPTPTRVGTPTPSTWLAPSWTRCAPRAASLSSPPRTQATPTRCVLACRLAVAACLVPSEDQRELTNLTFLTLPVSFRSKSPASPGWMRKAARHTFTACCNAAPPPCTRYSLMLRLHLLFPLSCCHLVHVTPSLTVYLRFSSPCAPVRAPFLLTTPLSLAF